MMTKPIHPDVPVSRAWQTGRRLYVRCGYHSALNAQLRALGAKWDPEERALWVGSTSRSVVVAAVQAAETRTAAVSAVKQAARWVEIPYEATAIRARAKQTGAVWDPDQKLWALPDDTSYTEIRHLVAEWVASRAAERHAAAQQRRQEQETNAKTTAERIIAESGRTPTGATAQFRDLTTDKMSKDTARERARPLGEVVKLRDGRRGLIVAANVWFTNADMASSACWHPETHDLAHWDFLYSLMIVEPTEAERADDAKAAATRADTAAIHDLMRTAPKLTDAHIVDRCDHIPHARRAGTISLQIGDTGAVQGGELILTRDDQVTWQHPGHYDDYIPTEGITTDPDVVARVAGVLAAGSRKRIYWDPQTAHHRYTVVVGDA